MSYKRKTVDRFKFDAVIVLFGFFVLAMIPSWLSRDQELVWPVSTPMVIAQVETRTITEREETLDTMVSDAVNNYFPSPGRNSEVKMIMHCLLHRESKHGYSKGQGDGGRASGPLQFHNPTWNAYRKIMMERGEAVETGDRHDLEMSIWTTVWAISDGRAKAWGPILRDSNGSDFASCPLPSWY